MTATRNDAQREGEMERGREDCWYIYKQCAWGGERREGMAQRASERWREREWERLRQLLYYRGTWSCSGGR